MYEVVTEISQYGYNNRTSKQSTYYRHRQPARRLGVLLVDLYSLYPVTVPTLCPQAEITSQTSRAESIKTLKTTVPFDAVPWKQGHSISRLEFNKAQGS